MAGSHRYRYRSRLALSFHIAPSPESARFTLLVIRVHGIWLESPIPEGASSRYSAKT